MKTLNFLKVILYAWLGFFVSTFAFAGSNLPWEGPLTKIMDSIQSPVAKAIGVILIIAAGIGIASSEGGTNSRKLFYVAIGLSIAFTATSFFLGFFGFEDGGGFLF